MSKIVYPDYDNSILNTITSILKYYNVETNHSTLPELDKYLEKDYKNVVLLILDGMGEIVLNNISSNGFFNRNKLKVLTSVYPCTTTAAMTSYYSGKAPIETGWIAWSQYFKEYGRCLDMLPHRESYFGEKVVSSRLDIFNDLLFYETIFDKIEKTSPDVSAIEVEPSYADRRSKKSFRAEDLDEAIDCIKYISKNTGKNFILAYVDKPDSLFHKFGCTSDEAKEYILDAEKKVEDLVNNLEDTLFIISADHGHRDIINNYTTCDDELYEMYSMPPFLECRCVSYFIKEDRREEFKKKFEQKYKDEFMLLTREEVYEKHLLGYGEKHKKVDDFIGDFLAISIGDSIINLENYLFEGKKLKKSTHCGLTEDEMLVPLIVIEKDKR